MCIWAGQWKTAWPARWSLYQPQLWCTSGTRGLSISCIALCCGVPRIAQVQVQWSLYQRHLCTPYKRLLKIVQTRVCVVISVVGTILLRNVQVVQEVSLLAASLSTQVCILRSASMVVSQFQPHFSEMWSPFYSSHHAESRTLVPQDISSLGHQFPRTLVPPPQYSILDFFSQPMQWVMVFCVRGPLRARGTFVN